MSKSAKRKMHDAKKRGEAYDPPVTQAATDAPETAPNDRWAQPQKVDQVRLICAASVIGTLLPLNVEIPKEFDRPSNPWNKLASEWFFSGMAVPVCRPGIDRSTAARHIQTCLRSFEPKHEHKIAGVAYLASRWFVAP